MKRPGLKSASKRQNVRLREKIKKRVAEHKRKSRKEAKKYTGPEKTKKQHIPNSAPFKDKILSEAMAIQERTKEELAQKKQAIKERRAQRRAGTIKDLVKNVEKTHDAYNKKQEVRNEIKAQATESDAKKEAWYRKELKYVVNHSDVILEVLDARDPNGCRCPQLEEQCLSNGKKIVLVLNKVDLVPKQIVQSWLQVLRKELPTVAFKASTQRQKMNIGRSHNPTGATAYGANELTSVLGGYSRNRGVKTTTICGVVGFPNVGKSSVINSLARNRVCGVSKNSGSTTSIQEIAIDDTIKLLDSPGVLFGGSAEKQAMRGALSASALADPVDGAVALLERCDQVQLALHYNSKPCSSTRAFLAQLAQKRGMMKKGGVPDLEASARQILQDCQRGKIKFFTNAPKIANHEVPEFLDAKIVTQLAAEFNTDNTNEWLESMDFSSTQHGATMKTVDDGFTELDNLEKDVEEPNLTEEEQEKSVEMEADDENVVIEFPKSKSVRFAASPKEVPEKSDLRKRQKVVKQSMKRKNKFETKLSENFNKALQGL